MNELTIINIIGILVCIGMMIITYKKERLSEYSKKQKKLTRLNELLLFLAVAILGAMVIGLIIKLGGVKWLYL